MNARYRLASASSFGMRQQQSFAMAMVGANQGLLKVFAPFRHFGQRATWRSGYAAVCKTVYPGSIPGVASTSSEQHLSDPHFRDCAHRL
jgi:hypothetical protein